MKQGFIALASAALLAFGPGLATAATLFTDNFNGETPGLNNTPSQWSVTNGTVDIIGIGLFDLVPGNGLYIDLDGSTSNAGTMTSLNPLSLTGGVAHVLSFRLAGSQRGDINSVLYGIDLDSNGILDFSNTLLVPSAQGFTTVNLAFTPLASTTTARIVFENAGGDNLGALVDNVALDSNPVVTPPPPRGNAPEPATIALLSGGLLGLGYANRRKKK